MDKIQVFTYLLKEIANKLVTEEKSLATGAAKLLPEKWKSKLT